MTGRRRLEIGLGALWLLDGALQLQPRMFTAAFFANTLGMGNMGLPRPLAHLDYSVTTMLVAHPGAWNSAFAGLQLLLGLALIRGGRAARIGRPVALMWALALWYLGEGFGGMFMGGASALNGAPGSALVYAALIWVTATEAFRRRALIVWSALWTAIALLETAGTNRMPFVPAAEIRNGASGEPGWLAGIDRAVGNLIGLHGATFAAVLGLVAAGLAAAPWVAAWRRPVLLIGMGIGAFLGLVGGGFGGLLTGSATDPGLGPLFVILGAAAWPVAVTRSGVAQLMDAGEHPGPEQSEPEQPGAQRPEVEPVRRAPGQPVPVPAG